MDQITSVIITVITVLGSAGAFRYYEKRIKIKHESIAQERQEELEEKSMYRNDLKERVAKLEQMLEKALDENKEARDREMKLAKLVAALETKVEYLEKHVKVLEEENKKLKSA